MPTPAVVDIGHGVEIDRSDVRASCKHAGAPVVAASIGMEIQGLGVRAMLNSAMGVEGGLKVHHLGQHFVQAPCRGGTSPLHPGEVAPEGAG